MVWIPKDWQSGENITEVDLDRIESNAEHIREESNYQIIGPVSDWAMVGNVHTPSLSVQIDGTNILAGSAYGEFSLGDESLSAFAIGLHTLSVSFSVLASSLDGIPGTVGATIRFFKTSDLAFLTLWGSVSLSTFPRLDYRDNLGTPHPCQALRLGFSAILHREEKFFV